MAQEDWIRWDNGNTVTGCRVAEVAFYQFIKTDKGYAASIHLKQGAILKVDCDQAAKDKFLKLLES